MPFVWWLFALWCGVITQAIALTPIASHDTVFSAHLEQPTAVITDGAGTVYALDGVHHQVVMWSSTGKVLKKWGETVLDRPLDMTRSGENIFIADTTGHQLAVFRADGTLLKSIPLPDASEPVSVAVRDGTVFWADRATHQICRIQLDTHQPMGCFGERGEKTGAFQFPFQMGWDRDGYVYVVDIGNARIQIFDKTGRYFSSIGRFGFSEGELYRPTGLAVDHATDTLFISDSYFGTISVFRQGIFLGKLQDENHRIIVLESPTGLYFQDAMLYVTETGYNRIHRYTIDFHDDNAPSLKEDQHVSISQKNCLLCHLSWASEAPAAWRLPDSQGILPEASFRMCYSCHNGPIMDSRRAIRHGAQHPTAYESPQEKQRHDKTIRRQEKLPEVFPVISEKTLLCTTCHTPHNQEANQETLHGQHKNAWLRVANQGGDLCERCHDSKSKGARETDPEKSGFNHPLGIKLAFPPYKESKGYVTDSLLQKGLPLRLREYASSLGYDYAMICQTCHQIHGGYGDGQLTVLPSERGEMCAICHPQPFSEDEKKAHAKGVHPINYQRKSNAAGVHPTLWANKPHVTEVTCKTCHAVHKGVQGTPLFPEDASTTKVLCKQCHARQHTDSAEEARRRGVHPVNVQRRDSSGKPIELWKGKTGMVEVTCDTCHKVHSGMPETALLPKGIETAESLCVHCHERQHAQDRDEARKKGIHPVHLTLERPIKIKDQEIKQMGCLSCHSMHQGEPETAALVETDQDGQLCAHCHDHKKSVVNTDHDLRVTAAHTTNFQGETPQQSGVCGTCHTLHRGNEHTIFLRATSTLDTYPLVSHDLQKVDATPFQRDTFCLYCHQKGGLAEKKSIEHFSHPYENLILRSDPTILPLLGKDEKVTEFGYIACVTCHDPHVWEGGSVKKLSENPIMHYELAISSLPAKNQEGTHENSFLRRREITGTFCVDCHGLETLPRYQYFHSESAAVLK